METHAVKCPSIHIICMMNFDLVKNLIIVSCDLLISSWNIKGVSFVIFWVTFIN